MTYPKPKGITYTQMAQWVDLHGTSQNCDENQLCQYLYHLVLLKTQQCSFFSDYEQIDDFCLYCVSRLYQRLRSPVKSEPVKSITNYIRIVISPWRADYIKEFCVGSVDCEMADFNIVDFSDYLVDVSSENDFRSFPDTCSNIMQIARKYLNKIPKKRKSPEWSNIYVSCLLTLRDRLTNAQKIAASCNEKDPQVLDQLIRCLRKRDPILYHVDESKANYITTLVNELTHAISAEISYCTHSKVSVSACMRNLVTAASNEEED